MVERNKPFVFNNALNKNRAKEKNKLISLNKIIREKLNNVTKCVLYTNDSDAPSITQVPQSLQREYAVITLFNVNNKSIDDFNLECKVSEGTLTLNKYKILGSKKFNTSDGPICKMVVKLI